MEDFKAVWETLEVMAGILKNHEEVILRVTQYVDQNKVDIHSLEQTVSKLE